jgi:hypothetical protein
MYIIAILIYMTYLTRISGMLFVTYVNTHNPEHICPHMSKCAKFRCWKRRRRTKRRGSRNFPTPTSFGSRHRCLHRHFAKLFFRVHQLQRPIIEKGFNCKTWENKLFYGKRLLNPCLSLYVLPPKKLSASEQGSAWQNWPQQRIHLSQMTNSPNLDEGMP